ncbi:hypothetical protein ACLKA7_001437 [Drosophila subpalustris]
MKISFSFSKEGQNCALRIGDWRIINRVDRGKQIELTFSVDPLSDEQLKSVGYRLCYGFGQVHIRQRSKHSAEAKNAPAVGMPVPGKVAQPSLDSQELPTCSNSLTTTTRSSEEQSSEAAGSNMAAPTPNAATTQRPMTSAPQVTRLRPPMYGRLQHKQGSELLGKVKFMMDPQPDLQNVSCFPLFAHPTTNDEKCHSPFVFVAITTRSLPRESLVMSETSWFPLCGVYQL